MWTFYKNELCSSSLISIVRFALHINQIMMDKKYIEIESTISREFIVLCEIISVNKMFY